MKFEILSTIKKKGTVNLKELAEEFSVSSEAIRKQILKLEADGYVIAQTLRKRKTGRPMISYSLSPRGDEIFPRKYDDLAIALVDALNPAQINKVFETIVEKKVRFWTPLLTGLSFQQKIDALKKIYLEDDTFMGIEDAQNSFRLIENNCPYLKVAMHQPMLCNITVSLLSRLLETEVKRVEKFQEGHGRCVFEIKKMSIP